MFGDTEHWPFKCPNCGNVIQELVGDMRVGNELTCPSCTHHYHYNREAFLRALEKAKQAVEEFGKSVQAGRNVA